MPGRIERDNTMMLLTLQNLTKRFRTLSRTLSAVSNLWLEVEQGEIVSLLGPSGCGKSTTLQLVAGVLQPDAGTIHLGGRLLNRVPPEQRDIALVLQRGLLFPHFTVGENVAFGLKMRGINRADREREAIAMLQQVQLEGFADRKPAELSGGQAQRVALARSLVIRPKLLLLDEPLSALDANLREEMQELILHLQAQTGVTMIIVTHDQAEAVVMSRRVALMFDGYLRQVATPEQVFYQPADEAIARFMGGVNFIAAQAQGRQWRVSDSLTLVSEWPQQGLIQFTIRPEQVQLYLEPLSLVNTVAATVVANRFTGTQRRVTLAIDSDIMLQAWVSPTQQIALGQTVWAHLPPDALWCFQRSTSIPIGSIST